MSLLIKIKKRIPNSIKNFVKILLAIKSNPKEISKIKKLAIDAQNAKDNEDWSLEIELRKQMLEISPNDYRSAIRLVHATRQHTGIESCKELADKFTNQFPNIPGVWREKGKNFLYDDPEQSLIYWKKAWDLEPNHIGTGSVLLRLYSSTHQIEEARKIALILIKLDPDNERIIGQVAKVLIKCFEFDYAEQLLVDGLQKYPDYEPLYSSLGDLIITKLRKCAQEQDKSGKLLPITQEHRAEFLNDPEGQFAEWNQSELKKVIDDCRKVSRKNKDGISNNSNEKKNILFVSLYNWNFMQGIVESFEKAGYNIKTLEFNDVPTNERLEAPTLIGRYVYAIKNGKPINVPVDIEKYYIKWIDWADVIYTEWCNFPAVWLSYMVPPEKKLVIRLHSYEAFTFWPHLVDWGNVDEMIHVADHIKEFLKHQIDVENYGTKTEILYNYNDLTSYNLPKKPDAEHTIGMIGYNNANKNPLFSIQLLKELIAKDPKWRLRLVGHNWPEEIKVESEKKYHDEFLNFIQANNLTESIDFIDFTENVQEEVTHIGYIISASEREGTHEVVIQAMGGGSIPIVRDWPMVKKWGGAHNMYPEDDIIDTVEQAAKTILRTTEEGEFDSRSNAAREFALKRFDQSVVMPKFIDSVMN